MGRKLNFTSLLFGEPTTTTTTTTSSSSSSSSSHNSWPWASCKQHPRTHSFRCNDNDDKAMYKTVNSVYFDSTTTTTTSSSSEDDNDVSAPTSNLETDLIAGLIKSGRFFFEAGSRTSSLLVVEEEDRGKQQLLVHDPIMVTVESEDPYGDFRRSMEEMVGAHKGVGGDQWVWLEELLVWYLRVNGKRNHGYIVGAFVDLLVGLRGEAHGKAHQNENENENKVISGGSDNSISDGDYGFCGSNSLVSSCEIEEVEEEESSG